jgi:hypothetical protein
MPDTNSLPAPLRLGLIGLVLFLAGGLISFGYSYRPLHGAKTWKISELEQRLDERNRENMTLGDELARFRTEEKSRVDPETLEQIEQELAKTRSTLKQLEKDLALADRKRKESDGNANRWRKRFETLRDDIAAAPAAPAPAAPATADPGPIQSPESASPAPGQGGQRLNESSRDPAGNGIFPAEQWVPATNQ